MGYILFVIRITFDYTNMEIYHLHAGVFFLLLLSSVGFLKNQKLIFQEHYQSAKRWLNLRFSLALTGCE